MNFTFERPEYLLLLPVIIGLLLFSMRFMVTRNKKAKIGQIIVRALLATALVLALSQVSLKWVGKDVTTIFLVDASDSVREQRDQVIKFVNDAVKTKGKHDYIGVIAFGSDTRVEQFVSEEIAFNELQTDVKTGATDLEEAVNMAMSQIPSDSAKRIVLITDGNENEGSLKDTIAPVIAKGCDFEIMRLQENVSDEVYVSDMTIPEKVGIGENFNINVEVESNVACKATVSLYSGRTLKGQQEVTLQKGTNQFIFKDTQTDEGLKTYRVVVDAKEDTVTVNNEFSAYTNISVELPLLVVEGMPGKADEFKRILDSIQLPYDCVLPSTVPVDISDFTKYSAIIFIDVYADDCRPGFTDNLENYIKNYGGGFIVTGGQNSFALGNYRDTPIETVLPVKMDLQGENEVPTMALQMVIDQSGSMSDGNGIITNLDLAKEAAVAALDNVRDTDYVGIMAFDDSYDRIVPLEVASNKEAIEDQIYTIGIDGGTSIYPALLAAATDVNNSDAMIKHIILLTDGQDTYGDYDELKKMINDAGITLSCVAVGTGCNDTLLRDLAESCGGRYFYTDINSDIPRIFAQEVFLSANTYLINEEFTPIVTSNDNIIKTVASKGLPSLLGYVATTPKDRAIQVLQSQYGDPVLTYWQYGLGKTVAWTSDVTGEWSGHWSGSEQTQQLWNNIIQYVTEDMGMEGAYTDVEQNGSTATIHYVTENYDAKTSVMATVFDDEGNVSEITLDPVKPGEYEADINTNATGVYSVNVVQKEGEEVISSMNTAAIMQYSMEYRFYPDNTLLDEYAAAIGGTFITEPSEVFSKDIEFVKSRWNLATYLLIFAVIWFILDIAVRRFHVDLLKYIPIDKWKKKFHENKEYKEAAKLEKSMAKAASGAAEAKTTDSFNSVNGTGAPQVPNESKKDKKSKKENRKAAKAEEQKHTNIFADMQLEKTYAVNESTANKPSQQARPQMQQQTRPVQQPQMQETRTAQQPQMQWQKPGQPQMQQQTRPVQQPQMQQQIRPVQQPQMQQQTRTVQQPQMQRQQQQAKPQAKQQTNKTMIWSRGADASNKKSMLDTASLLKGLDDDTK